MKVKRRGPYSGQEVKVVAKHIGMSVSKARKVIDQIRGLDYEKACALETNAKGSSTIFELIHSAAANAKNKGWHKCDLYIAKAEVNRSTIVKKLRPRARGRSYPIKRTMCHITIVLRLYLGTRYPIPEELAEVWPILKHAITTNRTERRIKK